VSSGAAGVAVDVHPAARRNMFDDHYELQAAIDQCDIHVFPDTGFGFPGSSLTYGSLAVRCSEM
jgi:hypothetical protein